MYRTDNPIADYDGYLGEQDYRKRHLPRCEECGEIITDEMCYEIDGTYLCCSCMESHKKWVCDLGEE